MLDSDHTDSVHDNVHHDKCPGFDEQCFPVVPKFVKICWQTLLVTWEPCVDVRAESCELIALHCTLPQSI